MPILNFEVSIGPSSIRIDSRTMPGENTSTPSAAKVQHEGVKVDVLGRDVPLFMHAGLRGPQGGHPRHPIAKPVAPWASAS